jgi:beta-1,4-mannosyl-glycoprotein beta-1,4-N-acetylglucosaminyltransferase
MLEIRLRELYDHVTLFLIVESEKTFTGKHKPLYLKENWSRFAKYHDKIRRVEINLTDTKSRTMSSWDREGKSRYDGIRLALPKSSKDFILLTSDVDEIPKAQFMSVLANCDLSKPFSSLVLMCDWYYYTYEFQIAQPSDWFGVTVSRFGPSDNITSDLRNDRKHFRRISSACFHCSYCFDRISSVREKLSSFSHTEYDNERNRNQQYIINTFKNGKDLFGRSDYILSRTKQNEIDLPKLLNEQPQRFIYMLNRTSSANAAFLDV